MKGIMIQGTSSDVGKSYVTTAICRILANKGYDVCPYKSQNMSNNSYVTHDGGEIGRAQGVQAEAAKVQPQTYMNPILLKPQKDTRSEIVLMGKVYKSESGMGYRKNFAMSKGIETIGLSKKIIEEKHNCIVIEGAGSPAEVNLNDKEIVNMRVAELFDVPVVLVVDIDKGGSFASVVGTLELVFEHRHRIKGIVINKFRGDIRLLEDGLKWLEDYTGVKVLGVIPYMTDIYVEVEDAQSSILRTHFTAETPIDIGVIHMGRVSNNTDIEAFIHETDVSVRIIKDPSEFGNPDAIVIPGTKSTIGDLQEMMDSKLGSQIQQYAQSGGRIVGICGGYQVLGETLKDPYQMDQTKDQVVKGLGLLPVETIFLENKQVRNISGEVKNCFDSHPLKGYEIHLGETKILNDSLHFSQLEDGTLDGCVVDNGRIMGSYLHNLFHNDAFRNNWLNDIRSEKGMSQLPLVDTTKIKEDSYEQLAKVCEEHLDMDYLIKLVEGDY